MIGFHGTNKTAFKTILQDGFNLESINNSRRFGDGIYFSDMNNVEYYGKDTVIAEIPDTEIIHFGRKDWQRIEDELIRKYKFKYTEFIPEYIKSLGYKCLCINWDGRGKELVVFDLSVINIIKLKT